jgi:Fe-S oxidoreductase
VPNKAAKRFDLATQIRICALCPNMCRFLCPVATVEKAETITPRGKATLTLAAESGDIPFTAGTAAVFYRCAQCKICREWCPSGVDLPEATASLRRRAAREGVAPKAVRTLAARLVGERSFYRPAAELAETDRYRSLLDKRAKVLYFAGCATAALHPEIIEATLRLFEAGGVKVDMLRPEECCGLPLDVLGYADEASEFAGGLAQAVAGGGYETIVTGCPMCAQVMKEGYPGGVTLGVEVKHVTEFLDGLGQEVGLAGLRGHRVPAGPGPGREGASLAGRHPPTDLAVTYHDPCYLGRYQGVYEAPRRLLAEVAGLEVVEMERGRELAACCGGAPAIDATVPATATAMASRRVAQAGRTGAGTLVTACPRCLEMLRAAAEAGVGAGSDASGDGPRGPVPASDRGLFVRDITEVLAERLGVRRER